MASLITRCANAPEGTLTSSTPFFTNQTSVLGDKRFHDARPQVSDIVDVAQVDFAQSTGECVEQFEAELGNRLFVARFHGTNSVRSMTAAGLMPAGRVRGRGDQRLPCWEEI